MNGVAARFDSIMAAADEADNAARVNAVLADGINAGVANAGNMFYAWTEVVTAGMDDVPDPEIYLLLQGVMVLLLRYRGTFLLFFEGGGGG